MSKNRTFFAILPTRAGQPVWDIIDDEIVLYTSEESAQRNLAWFQAHVSHGESAYGNAAICPVSVAKK